MAKWNSESTLTDLNDYNDSPVVKKANRRRKRRLLAITVAILGIMAAASKPAYHQFRKWQIDSNLETAKAATRSEDWKTARDMARSVLIARPTDFDALRIWFKSLAKMREPRTFLVAANLFLHPSSTQEDRIEALGILATLGPQAFAIGAFASLDKELQNETAVRVAFAPLLIKRGEFAVVEKMLREAPDLAADPQARFLLLQTLCCQPTPARVDEARAVFAKLIEESASSQALEALIILSKVPGGLRDGSPLPDLVKWTALQPKATTLHHLLALEPSINAAPADADKIIQKAIDRFISVDPGILGTWLISHGKVEETLTLLTEPAKTNADAYLARLHALLREKRFADLDAAFREPPKSVSTVELEMVRAAAAHQQGDSPKETNAWNNALAQAALDQTRNRYIELAQFAGSIGATKAARDSWVAAVRVGWGQIPLSRDLLPVLSALAQEGSIDDLISMYRGLLRFEPKNPELINNYNYLTLLTNVTPPDAAVKEFEKLVETYPKAVELHSGLAVAYLMANRPQDALAQVPYLEKSKQLSPIMRKAIEGTALMLKGDEAAGKARLDELDWKLFMPCESLAFNKMLARLKVKDLPLPELVAPKVAVDPATTPSWRKSVERQEKERSLDNLPALPTLKVPGADRKDKEPEDK